MGFFLMVVVLYIIYGIKASIVQRDKGEKDVMFCGMNLFLIVWWLAFECPKIITLLEKILSAVGG